MWIDVVHNFVAWKSWEGQDRDRGEEGHRGEKRSIGLITIRLNSGRGVHKCEDPILPRSSFSLPLPLDDIIEEGFLISSFGLFQCRPPFRLWNQSSVSVLHTTEGSGCGDIFW